MRQVLRPYVTSGIALVGASLIAVTPVVTAPADPVVRAVQLTDSWSDLITDTTTNWNNIVAGTDWADISKVIGLLFTNPLGVLGAFTNATPDVTTDLTSLPATISVQLPPGLELAIASLGSQVATDNAIQQVLAGASGGDFSALINGLPTILNAYLNGQDSISLLDGSIVIPAFNGILAPLQPMAVDLSLTKLVDALGLGDLKLTDLDLTSLLNQLGLGNLSLGDLFDDLGLSGKGLGDLLGDPTLGGLLNDLGLGDLGLGSLSLTGLLSGLGLDTNVDLNSLSLESVLQAFGLDPNIDIGLVGLLTNLGFGDLVNEGLGTLLGPGGLGFLTQLLDPLNSALNDHIVGIIEQILDPLGILGPVVDQLIAALTDPLSPDVLEDVLNSLTVGDLLGGHTLNDTLGNVLDALGVSDVTPSDLSIGGLLEALGFSASTGDLTLSGLLGDLGGGILGLNVGDLLNNLDLGDLLGQLGLSNLPLDLSGLVGDLSNLTLGGLLGDLGLGDLANISVEPLGGYVTELLGTVPQQILDALGG